MASKNKTKNRCVCQLLPNNRFTYYIFPQNTSTVTIKTISCCYILRILFQEYPKDFHAKNMANKSKLQLSLFEMEEQKNLISKENTTGGWMT